MDKWLQTKVSYEEDYYIQDVVDEMFDKIIYWINSESELELMYDLDSFKSKFYHFIYDKYHNVR